MIVAAHRQLRHYLKFIRTDGKKKRYEARLDVLMHLILSANLRLRAWPGIETIMKDTDFKRAAVVEALDWWEKRGAIYNVPADKRVGKERDLHGNKKLWQLTGLMEIEGCVVEYLLIPDEHRESIIEEIKSHGREDVIALFSQIGLNNKTNLVSQNETNSHSDTNMSSQKKREYAKLGSQNKPKIVSQNAPEDISKDKDISSKSEDKKRANAQAPARVNPQVEYIISLSGKYPPAQATVESDITRYGFDNLKRVIQVGIDKHKEKPYSYGIAKLEGEERDAQAKKQPSSSSGTVSPSVGAATDQEVDEWLASRKQPPASEPTNHLPTNYLLWLGVYEQLKAQLDANAFERVRNAKLVSWEGKIVTLTVPTEYDQSQCQGRLYRNIKARLSDAFGAPVELRFEVAPQPEVSL